MWPQIPENVGTLSAAELRELAVAIRTAALSALRDPEVTAETRTEVADFLAKRDEFIALADQKDADAATAAALQAEADAEVAAETEVEEATETAETEASTTSSQELATTTGVETEITKPAKLSTLAQLQAAAGLPGIAQGGNFESWAQLAEAVMDTAKTMTTGTRKTTVARIVGDYEGRPTIEDYAKSLNKFERDEIMAQACAPATPYYGLACENTMRRPVFASLPQFPAPRGKVSIPTSPTLADITGQENPGYGQWTFDDDLDPNAVKECAVVNCNSFNEYEMYAVWRCITIKNMLMMTYPELVEAYLNRLGAAWARLAEVLLLDAMATGATHINAKALGYGATTTLTTTLLEYLALYQETQRWDVTENMEVWAHRYLLTGIKMDLLRRRQTSGGVPRVPTDAEVNAIFANAGFNMNWTLDQATWMSPVAAVATGGNLNTIPVLAQLLIAPPGKFALIDRGELSIGVNGNNLYRDNSSNARNQFTLFYESFEGVVNTTSCPAHILDIPLC